ncbi:MAG: hypothetical protein IT338_00570, partial [Thermomicrobiales bacterium]|nr:hypothetical protein [Thermomicrobiales bacterium]
MDLRRFGSHVRTLGTTASRRQAFSAFLSGLFALLVLGLAAEAGRGKRRRKERSHHRPKRHGASQSDRCGRVHGDARGRKGGGAIFCRTTMPNGSRNDTGCAKGTPCCPTCAETRRCARGQLCCNG